MNVQQRLFQMQDIEYRDFNSKLIPNLPKEIFIGVRTPELKKLAKELYKSETAGQFLSALPHRYFEENQLHAFLIMEEKNFAKCLEMTKEFLPYVDNWATCDQLSPKVFYKNSHLLLPMAEKWLQSKNTYEVRFGISVYMRYFLDEDFKIEYAEVIAEIQTDEYYINMMISWYFATALYKQWDLTLPFLTENKLSKWVHNKAIQKAKESRRITKEQKELLNSIIQRRD